MCVHAGFYCKKPFNAGQKRQRGSFEPRVASSWRLALIVVRERLKESETHFFLAAFLAAFFFAFFFAFLAIGRSPIFASTSASLDTTAALGHRHMQIHYRKSWWSCLSNLQKCEEADS